MSEFDNEKCCIAKNVREIDVSEDPINSALILTRLREALGIRETTDWPDYDWCMTQARRLLDRLADLIEPEGSERTCDMVENFYTVRCTSCNRKQTLAPNVYRFLNYANYCPWCGARIERWAIDSSMDGDD